MQSWICFTVGAVGLGVRTVGGRIVESSSLGMLILFWLKGVYV